MNKLLLLLDYDISSHTHALSEPIHLWKSWKNVDPYWVVMGGSDVNEFKYRQVSMTC